MSAEVLRRAAVLMRERAEAATPDAFGRSWTASPHGDVHTGYSEWVCDSAGGTTAEHIASWHPAVALAVADWMDGVALFVEAKGDEDYFDLDGDPIAPEDTHAIGSALAVARAYLGEQP